MSMRRAQCQRSFLCRALSGRVVFVLQIHPYRKDLRRMPGGWAGVWRRDGLQAPRIGSSRSRMCAWRVPLPGLTIKFHVRPSTRQGLSAAGRQKGMQDHRSSLVSEPFRIWDCLLPAKCDAQRLRSTTFAQGAKPSPWRTWPRCSARSRAAGASWIT